MEFCETMDLVELAEFWEDLEAQSTRAQIAADKVGSILERRLREAPLQGVRTDKHRITRGEAGTLRVEQISA